MCINKGREVRRIAVTNAHVVKEMGTFSCPSEKRSFSINVYFI
jgi:hypothetical protein